MSNFETVSGSVGFVRSVFSKRAGAQAIPADLLRVACRSARLSAARRRVASAFSGYLVTEQVWPFSGRRIFHQRGVDVFAVTGGEKQYHVRLEGAAGGPLDAPYFLPSGAMSYWDSSSGKLVVSGRAYRWGCGS